MEEMLENIVKKHPHGVADILPFLVHFSLRIAVEDLYPQRSIFVEVD